MNKTSNIFYLRGAALFAALFLMIAAGCSNGTKEEAPATAAVAADTAAMPQETDSLAVDGETAATAKPNEVLFHGTIVLSPERHATVSVLMDGKIEQTQLLAGKYVQKGAVLATMANQEFINIQQTYIESHAQVEYLQAEYNRQKTLSTERAASEKRFQQSKADYLSMSANMESAAVKLKTLGINPESLLKTGIMTYLPIKAPVSGYLSDVSVNVGKYLHTGDALCNIIDMSAPLLKLTTYEKDIAELKVGNKVQFRVNSMEYKNFDAVVITVGQNVDPVNRSLDVYARIVSHSTAFRPGMYVSARMVK